MEVDSRGGKEEKMEVAQKRGVAKPRNSIRWSMLPLLLGGLPGL